MKTQQKLKHKIHRFRKKGAHSMFAFLPNAGRFSTFFHWQT